MPKVMIQPSGYDDCRKAVDRAFELFPLDVRDKKVLLKPNVLRGSRAEECIVTNPAVLRAVVDKVEEMKPASIIVGDNPGLFGYGANEASFRQTGLTDGAKGYYRNIGLESVEVDFNPEYLERVSISRAVQEADVVISLPKFKTHGLTVVTAGIKNSFGILPGAQKAMLHRLAGTPERFSEVIVDVFRLRVPDLFIMDAVVGMQGNGPASTELRHIGLILASDNAVALDSVVARMMGLVPGQLRFLQKAKELGLGDYEDNAVELVGELRPIPDFKLPPMVGGAGQMYVQAVVDVVTSRTLLRPKADPALCTACETCVNQCTVSALSMQDGLPVVDADTCITCFCCQEMCPEKAITLQ